MGQGSLIEVFATGLTVFPATKENANPFEARARMTVFRGLPLARCRS
jgi:hypothetical protein